MRRLLILSCSQRKRDIADSMPAVSRYDGNAYRVLKKYMRDRSDDSLDVYILSAEFGLISANQPIPFYDRKMTLQRAIELRPEVDARISDILCQAQYQSVLVACGSMYRAALIEVFDRRSMEVRFTSGPIGVQLAQLKTWLNRRDVLEPLPASTASSNRRRYVKPKPSCLIDVNLLQRARVVLAADPAGAARFSVWCADVDGQPVSAKWLLHKLTGRSLKDFTSQTAVRELRRMGFEVMNDCG